MTITYKDKLTYRKVKVKEKDIRVAGHAAAWIIKHPNVLKEKVKDMKLRTIPSMEGRNEKEMTKARKEVKTQGNRQEAMVFKPHRTPQVRAPSPGSQRQEVPLRRPPSRMISEGREACETEGRSPTESEPSYNTS